MPHALILCLIFPQEPATEGTVKAHANFNAETDARTLRDAMKGFGEHSTRVHVIFSCIYYVFCIMLIIEHILRLEANILKMYMY